MLICIISYGLFAIGSEESSSSSEVTNNVESLTDDEKNAIVGTYAGEDGSVLIFYDDGHCTYYYKNTSIKDCGDWQYTDGKLSFLYSYALIYANITDNNTENLNFVSDSFLWSDENYVKDSDNDTTLTVEESNDVIKKHYPEIFTSTSSDESSNVENDNFEEQEQKTEKEEKLEEYFKLDDAKKVIQVAMTNNMALDVFTDDGMNYDSNKFHNYSYSGEYKLIVKNEGNWSALDDKTWHVSDLDYKYTMYGTILRIVSADITYDGNNYIVLNVSTQYANEANIDSGDEYKVDSENYEVSDFNSFLTVTPDLLQ